jgi:membrane protein YqaA with SNARE-associated domain
VGYPVDMTASVARVGWVRRAAALSEHRYGIPVLAAIAFADSSFLPIPPDLLLVPMVLLRPERLRRLLAICTIASSLGAVLGYVIGYWLWSLVGQPLVELYGCQESFATYQRLVAEWGVLIIVAKAFTPIPFKIAAIAAGVAAMNPVAFIVAAVVGRALHFAMVGTATKLCGDRIMVLIARYERPLAVASVLLLIGFMVAYHFK